MRKILNLSIIDTAALPLVVLLSAGVIWLLVRQRDLALRWISGYPILAGLHDGVFLVLIAYTTRGLLRLLSEAPRLESWSSIAVLTGTLAVHLGYAWAFARLSEAILRRRKRFDPDWRLPKLTWVGVYGVFSIFGIVSFLVAEGRAPTELFVWTGASAAVLAFVMQETLGDLFSGFALTIERPFKIGDWIRLEDGTEGQVLDINWRATHLRQWDKTSFIIPNGKLARQSFTNMQGTTARFAPWYLVQVSGEHEPQKVIELLKIAASRCSYALPAPAPVVRLMSADSSPYTYMVWLHFENYPTMFAGREELYSEVDLVLRDHGIAVAADIYEVRYKNTGQ